MRLFGLGLFIVAAACLSGCGREPATGPAGHHGGRYLGIGVYQAGALWSRMVAANRPANAPAATVADDEQVIVVVDTNSGEIRQCGNFSGHCIGMNPWANALGQGQAAPVHLNTHAADLDRTAGEYRPNEAAANEVGAAGATPVRRR
jgi:hypothetical protein